MSAASRRLPHLVTSQVLGGVGVASGIAVGGLLAEHISGSASMAGLAQTFSVLGGALVAVPLAHTAERFGRSASLSGGYLIALAGAVAVLAAAVTGTFPLMLVGMALFGSASAVGLQARYAAIDDVDAEHRGRMLSIVVWATTVGSVLAPNLSEAEGRMGTAVGVPALSGPFLVSVVAFAVAAAVAATLPGGRRPLGHQNVTVRMRDALQAVATHIDGAAGLAAMAGAHAAMVGVMVMTPVHLGHEGATLQIIGVVISLHIAGMYALSPVMGFLTDRWGPQRTILLGVLVLLASLLTTAGAADHQHTRVAVGLTLLGLGWSACMVAGSALLSSSVQDEVRTRVQGLGDLVVGLSAAAAGVTAGPILATAGYGVLSLSAIALLVPIALLVIRSDLANRVYAVRP
jgi:MFS family permease